METAVESGRGRWSTAVGLTIAVLLLSVFDALALVLLPLAVLIVALPAQRRGRWIAIGVVVWMLGLLLGSGPLAELSRGWALLVGVSFLGASLARPSWDIVTRALTAVTASLATGGLALLATGRAAELDRTIRQHFTTVSSVTLADLQDRLADAPWIGELRLATERIAILQADLFPALLGLQSIAALALAAWWVRRLGRSDDEAFSLAPFREFRFSDQLIWVLIGSLALLLLPTGAVGNRIALNGLFFMAALYALRGLAIFVFLARGTRSIPTMFFGALALVILYPVAFTAALLMGVGDTWLDVRNRIAPASPV